MCTGSLHVSPALNDNTIIILIIIINMLMPVQQNSSTHLRVLLVLTDRSILA
jgi:hypothetical protein